MPDQEEGSLPSDKPSHTAGAIGLRIARAMFVVVFFWLFWKLGGFLLSVIIGRVFQADPVAKDAYGFIYKVLIFAIIYPAILKVLVPAFMPLFIEERGNTSEEAAWDFANTIANILLALNIALLCLGMVFTTEIVATLAPGFNDYTRDSVARMLRWMFPGIFLMNLCVMALALQNAYKVFSYPSAGDAVQKLLWAVLVFAGVQLLGVNRMLIAYGFLIGCVAQLAVNLVGLRAKLRLYRLRLPLLRMSRIGRELGILAILAGLLWALRLAIRAGASSLAAAKINPGIIEYSSWLFMGGVYSGYLWWRCRRSGSTIGRFAALASPLLISVLFARWRDLTTSFFQTFTKPGWFGDLEFAKSIGNLPHIFLGQTLAIAMLPYLCDLASQKNWKTFGQVLTTTLRLLAFVFLPMTIVLMILDEGLFRLVFDGGDRSEFSVQLGGIGLRFYVWGLLFFAIENALMQSFFSRQKVWWPTLLGIGAAVLHVLTLTVLINWCGFDYPYEIFLLSALILPASRAVKNTALLLITRMHVDMLPLRPTLVFAGKLLIVCVAVWGATRFSYDYVRTRWPVTELKRRRIVADTFNFECKKWWSRNAAELSNAKHPDEADPELGERCLLARYKLSNHRVVRDGIRLSREFRSYRLEATQTLSLAVWADHQAELRIGLQSWDAAPAGVSRQAEGGAWTTLEVPLAELGDLARVTSLVIIDATPPPPTGAKHAELRIDNILLSGDGVQTAVDRFEEDGGEWRGLNGTKIRAAELEEPGSERAKRADGTKERALRVEGRPLKVRRSLEGFQMKGLAGLSFKAKSDVDVDCQVSLVQAGDEVGTQTVKLEKGPDRKRYGLSLGKFGVDLDRVVAIEFQADAASLWLDNLELVSDMPRLKFELLKAMHVAVPSFAAFIVMLMLTYLLNLEEGKNILGWFRQHSIDRLRRKSASRKG